MAYNGERYKETGKRTTVRDSERKSEPWVKCKKTHRRNIYSSLLTNMIQKHNKKLTQSIERVALPSTRKAHLFIKQPLPWPCWLQDIFLRCNVGAQAGCFEYTFRQRAFLWIEVSCQPSLVCRLEWSEKVSGFSFSRPRFGVATAHVRHLLVFISLTAVILCLWLSNLLYRNDERKGRKLGANDRSLIPDRSSTPNPPPPVCVCGVRSCIVKSKRLSDLLFLSVSIPLLFLWLFSLAKSQTQMKSLIPYGVINSFFTTGHAHAVYGKFNARNYKINMVYWVNFQ